MSTKLPWEWPQSRENCKGGPTKTHPLRPKSVNRLCFLAVLRAYFHLGPAPDTDFNWGSTFIPEAYVWGRTSRMEDRNRISNGCVFIFKVLRFHFYTYFNHYIADDKDKTRRSIHVLSPVSLLSGTLGCCILSQWRRSTPWTGRQFIAGPTQNDHTICLEE